MRARRSSSTFLRPPYETFKSKTFRQAAEGARTHAQEFVFEQQPWCIAGDSHRCGRCQEVSRDLRSRVRVDEQHALALFRSDTPSRIGVICHKAAAQSRRRSEKGQLESLRCHWKGGEDALKPLARHRIVQVVIHDDSGRVRKRRIHQARQQAPELPGPASGFQQNKYRWMLLIGRLWNRVRVRESVFAVSKYISIISTHARVAAADVENQNLFNRLDPTAIGFSVGALQMAAYHLHDVCKQTKCGNAAAS